MLFTGLLFQVCNPQSKSSQVKRHASGETTTPELAPWSLIQYALNDKCRRTALSWLLRFGCVMPLEDRAKQQPQSVGTIRNTSRRHSYSAPGSAHLDLVSPASKIRCISYGACKANHPRHWCYMLCLRWVGPLHWHEASMPQTLPLCLFPRNLSGESVTIRLPLFESREHVTWCLPLGSVHGTARVHDTCAEIKGKSAHSP